MTVITNRQFQAQAVIEIAEVKKAANQVHAQR